MLIISYLLIVTVLLYCCFKDKIHMPLWIDLICIAVVVWFGIALYFAPNHYKGWPVPIYPPEMSFVKDSLTIEPTEDDPGCIYVWAISFTKPDGKRAYNPQDFLQDIKPGVPRVYKLPYSKEEQKKASKKKAKGMMLFFRNKKDGFKLINFQEILRKEPEQ